MLIKNLVEIILLILSLFLLKTVQTSVSVEISFLLLQQILKVIFFSFGQDSITGNNKVTTRDWTL